MFITKISACIFGTGYKLAIGISDRTVISHDHWSFHSILSCVRTHLRLPVVLFVLKNDIKFSIYNQIFACIFGTGYKLAIVISDRTVILHDHWSFHSILSCVWAHLRLPVVLSMLKNYIKFSIYNEIFACIFGTGYKLAIGISDRTVISHDHWSFHSILSCVRTHLRLPVVLSMLKNDIKFSVYNENICLYFWYGVQACYWDFWPHSHFARSLKLSQYIIMCMGAFTVASGSFYAKKNDIKFSVYNENICLYFWYGVQACNWDFWPHSHFARSLKLSQYIIMCMGAFTVASGSFYAKKWYKIQCL